MLKSFLYCALILLGSAIQAALPAGAGRKVATLSVNGARMIADPIRPFVYVATAENELAVIDTSTLKVVKKFLLGSNPRGLALSLDGSKLLVANTGSSTAGLMLVNLQTLAVEQTFALPAAPFDVAAGTENRAFVVLSNGQFLEVDLTDGSTQEFEDNPFTLGNCLQTSPDGSTLYVASLGYSPSSLGTFDATTSPPTFQKEVDAGTNAREIVLSHDGKILTLPSGGGNGNGYSIHLFDASNIEAHFGTLETGAYPHNGAFNLDDAVYYTAPDEYYGREIQVFSVASQQRIGGIPIGGTDIVQMVCDSSRRYLLCIERAQPSDEPTEEPPFEITVYSTGEKPFDELAGTYALTVTNVTEGYHSATFKLQPMGRYTGSLRAYGRKFVFTGDLLKQPSRTFTFSVAGFPPVILKLEVARESGERSLRASLDLGSGSVPLSVLKKTDFKIDAPPFAGAFTWYTSAESGEKLGPSTGRIVVKKSGAVTVSGVLGDQTRIAQSGFIVDGDKLVLNAPLFGGKGYFGGLVRFRDAAGQSDADATVSWVRPSLPKSKFRPEGFSLVRAFLASKYNVPVAGSKVLSFEIGEFSAQSDSQTSVPTTPVAFVTSSSLAPSSPDVLSFKGKFSAGTGRFSGSFILPGLTRRIAFSGYAFQKTSRAIGLFKTELDYGTALLLQEHAVER